VAKSLNALRSKSKTQTTRAKAPSQRQRGKAARGKPAYSQRSVAHTKINSQRSAIATAPKSAQEAAMPANLDRNTTLAGTEASELIRSASFLKSTSIFGQFYELSRIRLILAQASAQKLQRSFVALIGCRSPQEFFQLQNQLIKEQFELLAASIYPLP
jgi:Phasin protein